MHWLITPEALNVKLPLKVKTLYLGCLVNNYDGSESNIYLIDFMHLMY